MYSIKLHIYNTKYEILNIKINTLCIFLDTF